MLLRSARLFRWFVLLISLTIEAIAFWFGGPLGDPSAGFTANLLVKAQSASSWIWVGWVAFTLAWLFPEIAHALYSNGRRARGLLASDGGEELVYDTGLHWLVLLRDIRTGRVGDGDEEELAAPLFPKGPPSFTWYAVWAPVALATASMLFLIGWVAWLVATFPAQFAGWSDGVRSFVSERLGGFAGVAAPIDALIMALPGWLAALNAFVAENRLNAILLLGGAWIAANWLRSAVKGVPLAGTILRLVGVVAMLATLYAVVTSFHWLTPLYAVLPNNGIAAVGFIPLTFASVFYVWHVALWSSWRYAIIRDRKSHDAALVIVGGIFDFDKREYQIERIVDSRIHQAWWERLLGVGNIEVIEVGGKGSEFIRHTWVRIASTGPSRRRSGPAAAGPPLTEPSRLDAACRHIAPCRVAG